MFVRSIDPALGKIVFWTEAVNTNDTGLFLDRALRAEVGVHGFYTRLKEIHVTAELGGTADREGALRRLAKGLLLFAFEPDHIKR